MPRASVPIYPPPPPPTFSLNKRLLPLLLILGVLLVTFGLTASDNTAQATGPTPQNVATDWSLIPDGLGEGDQFRLLFVTSGSRNAASGNIDHYNTFVQNSANGTGVDATIRGMSAEFRAVASTASVHARDNTATTGTGVPIYWLDGDMAADDYADFYDDSWDSLQGKTQVGGDLTDVLVWTGSNADGTRESGNELGSARPNSGSLYGSSLAARPRISCRPLAWDGAGS